MQKNTDSSCKNRHIKRLLIQYCLVLLIGIVTGYLGYDLMNSMVFNSYIVGDSMNPTLYDNEYTIGIRFGWIQPELKRGDIISFFPPMDSDGSLFVKRIIGLPGETVTIEEGRIYINDSDKPIEEPYLKGNWIIDAGPYYFEVPDGKYLVLGDNRNSSYDSRNWYDPYVEYDSIQAKTCFLYRPFSCFKYIY